MAQELPDDLLVGIASRLNLIDIDLELPGDLLVLIASRLNLIEDYLNFRTVCKSWHSLATMNNFNSDLPRVPWLMLAEEEDNEGNSFRRFFSLYNGMILNKRIPEASRKRCLESMGWLITVGEEGETSLLHPFSGVQIELPHLNTTQNYDEHMTDPLTTFIEKAVLSASPSHTSDYVLMVIDGNLRFLSYWRPGDLRWTRVIWEGTNHYVLTDLLYFNGQIYAVNWSGKVIVCDVADVVGPEPTKSHIVAQVTVETDGKPYILESLGSLFVIVRYGTHLRDVKDDCDRIPLTYVKDDYYSIPLFYIHEGYHYVVGYYDYVVEEGYKVEEEEESTYGTTNFQVFQVDLATGKMTETRELGDRAFFLGANASLSVQASQFPGIKPNHIYYTDDFFESYLAFEEGGGSDMGVFNLADGSIQRHYNGVSLSRFCPPTWVTPTLY